MKKTDLIALAIKAKDGAAAHPEITLTQNTSAKINTDCAAASAAEAEYQTAVAAIVPLQQAYLAAIASAYAFAQRAKDVLKPHCGNQHCALWNAAGFVTDLVIPQSWNGLRVLLGSLGTFFSANAAKEVAALRVRLRGLADELKQLIGRDDARWRVFGLNIPAEPAVPPQPESLTVTNDTPLQLLVRCDPVLYADHYRWWRRAHNGAGLPEEVGSSDLPMFLIEELAGNTHWDIYVSAVNSNGVEGPFSAPAQGDVLAAAA